jgi:tRNA pseudouridine55 synthase
MDGLLIIDKPTGMTSHDVVFRARKCLQEPRIGHTGTLDPLATGVLVLCVGRATKLVPYLTDHDKRYEAEVCFGIETDTLDTDGTVIRQVPCPDFSESQIDAALNEFLGPQMQIPPKYSSIKIDGRKLYDYARKNQEIPMVSPRPVVVHSLRRNGPFRRNHGFGMVSLSLHCGKGFYVRSLVRDLGAALGIPATLSALRRTAVGTFTVEEALPLEQLGPNVALRDPFASLSMPRWNVPDSARKQVENGAFLPKEWFSAYTPTILCDAAGKPLAIYDYDERIGKMRLSVMW